MRWAGTRSCGCAGAPSPPGEGSAAGTERSPIEESLTLTLSRRERGPENLLSRAEELGLGAGGDEVLGCAGGALSLRERDGVRVLLRYRTLAHRRIPHPNPLPKGEGTREPSVSGRGTRSWGGRERGLGVCGGALSLRERDGVRVLLRYRTLAHRRIPHPNPLPEGEGTREPSVSGRGTRSWGGRERGLEVGGNAVCGCGGAPSPSGRGTG